MDLYDMREDEYLSYDQIIEMDVELDYLVDTLIRDKCVSVLSALPKMGKTSFAISLVVLRQENITQIVKLIIRE